MTCTLAPILRVDPARRPLGSQFGMKMGGNPAGEPDSIGANEYGSSAFI